MTPVQSEIVIADYRPKGITRAPRNRNYAKAKDYKYFEPIECPDVTFTIPGDPHTKSRARYARLKSGKTVVYSDPKMVAAEHRIVAAFRAEAGSIKPATRGIGVHLEFHLIRRQRRDVDNFTKLVLDALNGLAWLDDSQVTDLTAKVVHGADEPKTVIHLYPTDSLPDPLVRQCRHCGKNFRVYASWHTKAYCGQECLSATLRKRRERKCVHCGEVFVGRKYGEKESIYCSMKCKSDNLSVNGPCQTCGVPVHKPISQYHGQLYCSTACAWVPKTHCPYGHKYDPDNTYVNPRGRKECTTCRRERSRARREAKAQVAS